MGSLGKLGLGGGEVGGSGPIGGSVFTAELVSELVNAPARDVVPDDRVVLREGLDKVSPDIADADDGYRRGFGGSRRSRREVESVTGHSWFCHGRGVGGSVIPVQECEPGRVIEIELLCLSLWVWRDMIYTYAPRKYSAAEVRNISV